jgi:hypothetical protein
MLEATFNGHKGKTSRERPNITIKRNKSVYPFLQSQIKKKEIKIETERVTIVIEQRKEKQREYQTPRQRETMLLQLQLIHACQ